MIEIEEKDLLDLIHWARRYCDKRMTYAPNAFNKIYKRIFEENCLWSLDTYDHTLYNNGQFWPYAQDGQYDPLTGRFDAMERKKEIDIGEE